MQNGQLAEFAGVPLVIEQRGEHLNDIPAGGALLEVSWAVANQSYTEWYPSVEAAKAALLKLARSEGRAPAEDGMYVDLTASGCHSSSAWVVPSGVRR